MAAQGRLHDRVLSLDKESGVRRVECSSEKSMSLSLDVDVGQLGQVGELSGDGYMLSGGASWGCDFHSLAQQRASAPAPFYLAVGHIHEVCDL